MEQNMKFCVKLRAANACFADPITKTGGERQSYPIPTYSGLVGCLQSIYWKPTFWVCVDRCRVINPIQMETRGMLYPRYDEGEQGDRAYATNLKNVEYNVEAHLEWDLTRPDLAKDRIPEKHMAMLQRAIRSGGRRAPFLGKRETECYAEVSPINDIMEGQGAYDYIPVTDFGMMLHGVSYADKNYEHGKPTDVKEPTGKQFVRLWDAVMKNGVITYPHPADMQQFFVREMKLSQKEYIIGKNMRGVEEEVADGLD